MNCEYCGNPVPQNVSSCPSCGAPVAVNPAPVQNNQGAYQQQQQVNQQQTIVNVNPKSPGLATFLSCLIVGLGQIYNGQVAKGICMFIIAVLIGSFTAGVGSFFFWIFAMIDASKIAKKINSGIIVGAWEF